MAATKKNGEHTTMVGGLWGTINLRGETIIPIKHSRDELYELLQFTPKTTN